MLKRNIAVAWILTADHKTLLGQKNSNHGIWLDKFHQPGGGQEKDESIETALIREVREETGLDIGGAQIDLIDDSQTMTTEKVFPNGEKVDCEMRFFVYLVKLPKPASDYTLIAGDDLINLQFIAIDELEINKLTPPAVKIAQQLGWGKLNIARLKNFTT